MLLKKIVFVLFSILMMSVGTVLAANEGVVDTPLYSITGVIDDIRLDEHVIVISDKLYSVASFAKIHGNKKYPNVFVLQNLKQGMIVGIKLGPVGNNPSVITEVWLLESLPQNDDEDN